MNGTFLNGVRIGLAPFATSDVLRVGDTELRIDLRERHATSLLRSTGFDAPPTSTAIPTSRSELRIAIPGYTLGRCIGEGATSAVFAARRDDGAVVAIKVIGVHDAATPEDRARFEREAQLAVTLEHPNVVRTLGQGAVGSYRFLEMELVDGETLAQKIAREGRQPVVFALEVARAIASALEYARERGIVHRDVKPGNILVRKDGVVKLADFGLAKSTVTSGISGLTRAGDVLGTLAYMSPEQLESSLHADHRSDLYSLGATIHHMLAGETPFQAKTNVEYFQKILRASPPVLATLRRDVSPIVSALVERCLRKDPRDRYATAEDIVRLASRLLATGRGERNTVA